MQQFVNSIYNWVGLLFAFFPQVLQMLGVIGYLATLPNILLSLRWHCVRSLPCSLYVQFSKLWPVRLGKKALISQLQRHCQYAHTLVSCFSYFPSSFPPQGQAPCCLLFFPFSLDLHLVGSLPSFRSLLKMLSLWRGIPWNPSPNPTKSLQSVKYVYHSLSVIPYPALFFQHSACHYLKGGCRLVYCLCPWVEHQQ